MRIKKKLFFMNLKFLFLIYLKMLKRNWFYSIFDVGVVSFLRVLNLNELFIGKYI